MDIDDWEKEFDDKMGNYTDGLPEMYIKGAKPVTKGFWLRSGMDGDIDEQALKDFIRQKIAQEANKARLDELDLLGENYPPTNKFNTRLNLYIDARTIALTADKEQA